MSQDKNHLPLLFVVELATIDVDPRLVEGRFYTTEYAIQIDVKKKVEILACFHRIFFSRQRRRWFRFVVHTKKFHKRYPGLLGPLPFRLNSRTLLIFWKLSLTTPRT